jgi:hypothetical protein
MLRIQKASERMRCCPRIGTLVHVDSLTGFGNFEPAPIKARRHRASISCAPSRIRSLASALAAAINPWGNLGSPSCRANNYAQETPVNTRRMSRLFVLAAGATASLLAYGAHGQEPGPNVPVTGRSRPEYDPLGIRAGGFLIYPSFTVDGAYNDNIFADDENEESDFIFTYSPRIDFRSNFPRHSLRWTLQTDVGQYIDNTDENFWDYGTNLAGRLDITRNNRLIGSASYAHGHDARDDPDDPGVDVSDEPVQFDEYGGTLGFEQEFNRFNVRVLGSADRVDYDEDEPDTFEDARDRNLYGGRLRTGYFISPRINAFLEGGYEREVRDSTDRENTPPLKRDNNVYDGRVGTAIDITGLVFGEVSVGWAYQEFDESELDSENDLVYGAGLTWNPTQLTSLSLDGNGGFEPSDTGSSRLTHRVALRVDHELLRNVLIGGRIAYRRDDFQNDGRVDNRFDVGPDITYLINRYLSVGAGYTFTTRDSDDDTREFDRNVVSVRLTAQL